MSQTTEKHAFKAEVNQVLSLVVNSLYTHKEVFLRELVSNAADALDHLSFRALTEPDVMEGDAELKIDLIPDADARTLTIRDNGVGMTRETLIQNLGTIAHSGSRKLVESLSGNEGQDLSLIGQFGVGFYSAFLVAERVVVVTRAAGEEGASRWESEAKGEFSVEDAERGSRGTDVILHLREGEDEFLKEHTLRPLVRKYSDFVRHPIRLRVEREKPAEKEGDESTETTVEWEQLNHARALWTRAKSDVTDEQYDEFYKHLSHDWEAPLARTHFRVEGLQQFAGLLFVPRRAPVDFLTREPRGMRLFVKRVFIMDECQDLLPEYLRFVRGVVDSDDLPLNVSREFLQKDRTTATIRKQVVRHVLKMLEEMADEKTPDAEAETEAESDDGADDAKQTEKPRYEIFWSQFGRVLKEGIHFDRENKDRIAMLLRYGSSRGAGQTSLADYVERMDADQPGIYYLVAQSRTAAEASPHIEALRKRGYEILYMTDPVDEWVVEGLREFQDKKLISAAKGALDLPSSDEEKEQLEEKAGEFKDLLERMKETLKEKVQDVRMTDRLTDSPACLVGDEHQLSPHVERMLRAQGQEFPAQKRILEINPGHPVIARLRALADDDAAGERLSEWTQLLMDQALVAEGSPPSDPAGFARRITALMQEAAG